MPNSNNQWNEATRVQMPTLVHLSRIGYTYFGKITDNMANTIYDHDNNRHIQVAKATFDGKK